MANTKRRLLVGLIEGKVKSIMNKEIPQEDWSGWVWADKIGWHKARYTNIFLDLNNEEVENVYYWIEDA